MNQGVLHPNQTAGVIFLKARQCIAGIAAVFAMFVRALAGQGE